MARQLKKESVWDYPRPAICEPFDGAIKAVIGDITLAQSQRGYRTLETSLPPSYYFPVDDVAMHYLAPSAHTSFCEWKGRAIYYDFIADDRRIENIAWTYPNPTAPFRALAGHLSFYAAKCDRCYVNDERVQSQEGVFYGGWITRNLEGPFKGAAGTEGW